MKARNRNTLFAILLLLVSCSLGVAPLYWTYWWYDMFIHTIIGISMSIVLFRLISLSVVSVVILYNIIIAWEIFEYVTRFFIIGYWDTLLDISITSVAITIAILMHIILSETTHVNKQYKK